MMNISHAFAAALLYAEVVTVTLTHTEQCAKLCGGCWSLRAVASTEVQEKWMHAQGGYFPHQTLTEVLDLLATWACHYEQAVEELTSPPVDNADQLVLDV